uniref:Uncharacterized protein n=1 Tax=Solanum lycopersicum TaxID=4081 RepID=A0A3Q7J026_SOLLC
MSEPLVAYRESKYVIRMWNCSESRKDHSVTPFDNG